MASTFGFHACPFVQAGFMFLNWRCGPVDVLVVDSKGELLTLIYSLLDLSLCHTYSVQ